MWSGHWVRSFLLGVFMRVRATEPGYYGLRRIKEGQEFHIKSEKDLGKWMEPLDLDEEVVEKKSTKSKGKKSKGKEVESELPPEETGEEETV
jgi:hypothetical protein